MKNYKFTLQTHPTKMCHYAGLIRNLKFTGSVEGLLKYIAHMSQPYERVTDLQVKIGDEWVKEEIKENGHKMS